MKVVAVIGFTSLLAVAACGPPGALGTTPPEQPELLTYYQNPWCWFFCEAAIEQIDEVVTAEGGGSITNTTQGGAISQEEDATLDGGGGGT